MICVALFVWCIFQECVIMQIWKKLLIFLFFLLCLSRANFFFQLAGYRFWSNHPSVVSGSKQLMDKLKAAQEDPGDRLIGLFCFFRDAKSIFNSFFFRAVWCWILLSFHCGQVCESLHAILPEGVQRIPLGIRWVCFFRVSSIWHDTWTCLLFYPFLSFFIIVPHPICK